MEIKTIINIHKTTKIYFTKRLVGSKTVCYMIFQEDGIQKQIKVNDVVYIES